MTDEPASFEEFLHLERDRLFRVLCVITGNRQEAEDSLRTGPWAVGIGTGGRGPSGRGGIRTPGICALQGLVVGAQTEHLCSTLFFQPVQQSKDGFSPVTARDYLPDAFPVFRCVLAPGNPRLDA